LLVGGRRVLVILKVSIFTYIIHLGDRILVTTGMINLLGRLATLKYFMLRGREHSHIYAINNTALNITIKMT
jgi:hypothetical protein